MSQRSATEFTAKFATTVDDLTDAWSFVMAHVDDVGPSPQVRINPVFHSSAFNPVCGSDEPVTWGRFFEVSVSGMVEQDLDGTEGSP